MKKFTNEQIIEIFRRCNECDYDGCYDCVERQDGKCVISEAENECLKQMLAENESLKQMIDERDKETLKLQKRIIFWREDLNYQPEKIKSEAIKDFAEKLKEKVKMYNSEGVEEGDLIDDLLTVGETVEIIDNLVKEMTEER